MRLSIGTSNLSKSLARIAFKKPLAVLKPLPVLPYSHWLLCAWWIGKVSGSWAQTHTLQQLCSTCHVRVLETVTSLNSLCKAKISIVTLFSSLNKRWNIYMDIFKKYLEEHSWYVLMMAHREFGFSVRRCLWHFFGEHLVGDFYPQTERMLKLELKTIPTCETASCDYLNGVEIKEGLFIYLFRLNFMNDFWFSCPHSLLARMDSLSFLKSFIEMYTKWKHGCLI